MKAPGPIGGFFELELPRGSTSWHPRARALSSGRACLRAVLEARRPRRVHVPYYCCDVVIGVLRSLGIAYRQYALNSALEPADSVPAAEDELFLYVDYFGLRRATTLVQSELHGPRLVLDATQSFFVEWSRAGWAFNSARKCFGVPDGGFLYGAIPAERLQDLPENDDISLSHLVHRLAGQQELAYDEFRRYEASLTAEIRRMSPVSLRLLSQVDRRSVARARRENYMFLARQLDGHNQLALPLETDAVPFCYPWLPVKPFPRQVFIDQAIFVPSLWPECTASSEPGFDWERDLASRLLPLPIDHRYGATELSRVLECIRAGGFDVEVPCV